MGKSKSPKQEVVDYRMSVHVGVCLGPVDAILGIYINEKEAWSGELTTAGAIQIHKPDLFGGETKEGGPEGTVYFLPGKADQVLPDDLAARFGLTGATAPGFRGLTSLFFVGGRAKASAWPALASLVAGLFPSIPLPTSGFLWTKNNPVIAQTLWAKVRRIPRGLGSENAQIGPDANPAHMIWECLTDDMGAPESLIDKESFEAAAATLAAEGLGLSMIWTRQDRVESFIGEILDHIEGTIFVHPRTGLITLRLIRDDYDAGNLRVIDPDNAVMTSFQRRMLGETVNEIQVNWTNPENEQQETVTVQDLGNIAAQGGQIVSETRSYYGVRNAELAKVLAERDLRSASAPLASAEVEVGRWGWDLTPGDVVRLDWPEYDVAGAVMRVVSIDYGKPGEPRIRLSLVEDVFSLAKPLAVTPPGSHWVDPAEPPAPMDAAAVFTLPFYFAASTALQGAAVELQYPEVTAGILAYRNSLDTRTFQLAAREALPTGEFDYINGGVRNVTHRTVSPLPLDLETETAFPAAYVTDPARGPRIGGFAFIGDGSDDGTEIALITDFDGTNWTLSRGVLDTVPRAWPAGTPIWWVNPGAYIADDQTVRVAGEEVEYKLLTETSRGVLDLDDAPVLAAVLTERPHRPLRPANVKVNGSAGPTVDVASADEIHITWATRNRLFEDGLVLAWTDGPVAPEYKQRTVIVVRQTNGAEIITYNHLWTETEFVIEKNWLARWSQVDIEVWAERDDLLSHQRAIFRITGLPGNPGAELPPPPPDPGDPPPPVEAPGASAFQATGGAVSDELGTSIPALIVSGTPDNSAAVGLIIRYRKMGSNDWTYHPQIALSGRSVRVEIAGIAASTYYEVEVAYRTADNILSYFRSLPAVQTGQLVASDVIHVAGRSAAQLWQEVDDLIAKGDLDLEELQHAVEAAEAAQAAAEQAQLDAAQARQAAEEAAQDAYDRAQEAAVSASNAETSATAAAGSAETASNSASEAADHAQSASAAANTASVKAGEAEGHAEAASTSASTALAAKDDAQSSAEAAQTARVQAETLRNQAGGYANAASQSAVTAAGHATAAEAWASAAESHANTAATEASNAQTAANSAATARQEAESAAAAAGQSAQAAANSATQAGNQASAASGYASAAQTSANAASAAASAASSHADTAEAKAGEAEGYAQSAANSAATASDKAAEASQSATLAANVGTGALNRNPNFNAYPNANGLPTGWTGSAGTVGYRVVGPLGGYAYRINSPAEVNYIWQDFNDIRQNQWFVIEADVTLNSGSLTAAGVLFRAMNDSGTVVQDLILRFPTDEDISGAAPGAGVLGRTYRYRKLVRVTAAGAAQGRIIAMTNWTTIGALTAKDLTWHRCAVRPASGAEIAAQTALLNAADAMAAVTNEQLARVQGDNALAQSIQTLQTNVQSNYATIQSFNLLSNRVGGVEAKAGVRLDVNGRVTGWIANNDGSQGTFDIVADSFRIVSPGTNPVAPFEVVGGVTRIKEAQIGNLTIGTEKIKNNAVTVPVIDYVGTTTALTTSWVNLASCQVASGGGTVFITATVGAQAVTTVNYIELRLLRNGGVIYAPGAQGVNIVTKVLVTIAYGETPPAGSQTYVLQGRAALSGSGVNVSDRSLFVISAKR